LISAGVLSQTLLEELTVIPGPSSWISEVLHLTKGRKGGREEEAMDGRKENYHIDTYLPHFEP